MTDFELGKAVGLFEGEGSFNVILRKQQNIFRPVVTFSGNNPVYHLWLWEYFPEYNCPRAHRRGVERKCKSTYWQTIPGLRFLLSTLIPHLTGKKRVAECVLELTNGFRGSGIPSKLSREQQQALYDEVKYLNNQEYDWDSILGEEVLYGADEELPI